MYEESLRAITQFHLTSKGHILMFYILDIYKIREYVIEDL